MSRGTVAHKLIESRLVEGRMEPGEEIAIRVDQTLTQDATGTMVMLEFEAMGLPRVRTDVSAQYVDHNLLQTDFKNADDHLFLYSACQRFGIWYSRPGNGVSHPVHMERLGVPGRSLLGSDSHTPAAGSLGMLALGVGGLDVALAMAGRPFYFRMPQIWGIRLVGELPPWVSAKDVILEMLRRHGVSGGLGRILEYRGPGLARLSAMDRHVIANMGAELGATTTVFPSDEATRRFLKQQDREDDWAEILADADASYDLEEEIDLSRLEPLIALPSSPGSVVPVAEVAGEEIYQSYIGSSANPGFRDFAVTAALVRGRQVHPRVSLDVNPTSRQILENLAETGLLQDLIRAGARVHQPGCNGCIGMGQAPASGGISLRTVPRNFPGRSGTPDDRVYLCSPETAAASALTGRITDPRSVPFDPPDADEPRRFVLNPRMLVPPPPEGTTAELVKGPNIQPLPDLDPVPDRIEGPVLLKLGDDVSTDEIMPAGQRVLPFRSNIPAISRFVFADLDPGYADRARESEGGHLLVAGDNYGQGSSREHAALAPRYLGLRAVIAKRFARIHRQNLANFGIVPLVFSSADDYDRVEPGDVLVLDGLLQALQAGSDLEVQNRTRGFTFPVTHDLRSREIEALLAGSSINVVRQSAP